MIVKIKDFTNINQTEIAQLRETINKFFFAIYDIGNSVSQNNSIEFVHKLAKVLRLNNIDKSLGRRKPRWNYSFNQ